MTALTHVELLWLKDRIENRIRFSPIAQQHVLDRRCRVPPSFRESISCAPLPKASAIQRCLMFVRVRELAPFIRLAKGSKGVGGD